MSASPKRPHDVSLAPLQERFRELQARGVTASDIALRLGWFQSAGHNSPNTPDASRFLRAIGLRECQGGNEHAPHARTHVTEKNALKIGQAMGLDPWELDL